MIEIYLFNNKMILVVHVVEFFAPNVQESEYGFQNMEINLSAFVKHVIRLEFIVT